MKPRTRLARPVRLSARETFALGVGGLLTRRARTALSALGVAIGIAALVAVMSLASASKADLMAQLDALGTNMLRVSPGQSLTGEAASLPASAPGMVRRIPTVEEVSATYATGANVYRSEAIPADQSSGLAVLGADLDLLGTVRAELASGRWLDEAINRYPVVVLGAKAAERLGIVDGAGKATVWIAGVPHAVVGVLRPVPLAPELDTAALIGSPSAERISGALSPATVYARVLRDAVDETRPLLARTANPAAPAEAAVSRPSEALSAQAAADKSLTQLSIGLGGVGLLVGGVGIANVMVVAVMERRREIGVRRALGATRGQIRTQFLIESVLLAGMGGMLGATLGAMASTAFASLQGWPPQVSWLAVGLGLAGSIAVGALAGAYPAARAARVAPTEALRAV